MRPLRIAQVVDTKDGRALFALERGWRCEVSLPIDGIGRVLWHPPGGLREPRTWAIAPASGDEVPWEGRERTSLFTTGALRVETGSTRVMLTTAMLRADVRLAPFGIEWQQPVNGTWRTCCVDRPTYAYAAALRSTRIVHSMTRDADDQYFGLGDKTGPLDKHGRRMRTLQLDALGYNGETSDPLYKHWPFFLGRRRDSGLCYGVYYDTLSETTFDFGQEYDNYHGFYRSTEIADGDLDCYVFAGPGLEGALRRFVQLVGGTALSPRWSLGFANTAMGLVDAPDAQVRLMEFLDRAKRERIPLSAFHFGSGYTSRGKRRYVFTWNRDKFPDPKAATAAFRAEGVKLVANLKPCLLDDHPAFAEVRAQGGFVGDSRGEPCLDQFWDGWGAHLDFTHPAGRAWWQRGLATQILDYGIDAAWNDNNEFEIWDEDGRSHGFGEAMPIARSRPLHALLMTRASYETQAARAPDERVYTVTRAGTPGIARYAQTWSGDNTTSWHTLRWNQRMALTMGLSGMFDIGHDVGGFAGPVPDAELLVRWLQACALNPRCIMNSWKADGSVNTPWLHPEVTDVIRATIELRLSLVPYLYTCLHDAVANARPVLRPTFWEFPDDPRCWAANDEMLVGPNLLVAPVFEPGTTTRSLYLPQDDATPGWRCYHTGAWHRAGTMITVDAPLDRLPLFVRANAVIPTTDSADGARRTDEPSRALRLFPAPPDIASVSRTSDWIEDDGITERWKTGELAHFRCTL
ncbi:MAG TPA: TIM-barrel domain-containing protein, partial [Casimicrobiaceae bacterium]|nr:TIM-barrel domain-containing protein [Casimicrobiaceae bacterium]